MFLNAFLLTMAIIGSFGGLTIGEENLILVQVIVRHGERYPYYPVPNFPLPDGIQLGNLTKNGIEESLRLGRLLRSKYLKFITKDNADVSSEIKAYSSNTMRTILTARLVLRGLLNESPADIPVNIPQAIYTLTKSCPKWFTILKKHFKKIGYIKKYQKIYDKIKRLTGLKEISAVDFQGIANSFFTMEKFFKVPNWTTDEINVMKKLYSDYLSSLIYCTGIIRTSGGFLVKRMMDHCKAKADGKLNDRFEIYVSHDDYIMAFEKAFHVRDGFPDRPYFNDGFIVECYKNNSSPGNIGLKLAYINNLDSYKHGGKIHIKNVELQACKHQELCDINTLESYLKRKNLVPNSFQEECL